MDHISPSSCIEKHNLSDSDDVVRFAFGKNVVLHVAPETIGTRQRDSARANSQALTDYKWENKSNYAGRILAVRDKLVAYRLFNENTGEAIRVLERETRARHLIKDFRQPPIDLQWAVHAPFLAVLDANSNVYVYHVDEKCNTLSKYLNIIRDEPTQNGFPKLTWCPYIPEDETESNKDVHLLAVSYRNCVDIYSLHTIKSTLNRSEVRYDQLSTVPGGVLSIVMDSEITSLKLSPDATAMAVSTEDGYISFYVIDTDKTRFANRVRPIPNSYAEEILFLDNLSLQNQDQFWKFVLISADSGRRLAIYDCDSWNCLGKLRFESPNQISRLEVSVDQTGYFIFMADYDSSSLYCLELNYLSSRPCFTACTRITFFNTLICVVPCSIAENTECDLSLEESDEFVAANSIFATFVAITNRSLMEMSVELERHQLDPAAFILGRSGSSAAENNSNDPIIEPNLVSAASSAANFSPPVAIAGGANISTMYPTPPVDVKQLESLLGVNKNNNLFKKVNPTANSVVNSTNVNNAAIELSMKIAELMDDKFGALNEKIDSLQADMEKLKDENRALREQHTDNLSNALEKISNELKEQSDRVEAIIGESANASREQIVGVVEASLSAGTLNLQSVADLSKAEILNSVSSTVHQMLVPAVEGVCTQMFQQLNETFRSGLQEFMDQMIALQRENAKKVFTVQISNSPNLPLSISSNSAAHR